MDSLTSLDVSIIDIIQNFIRNDLFDWFFPKITMLGNAGVFWITLGVLLLFPKKTRKTGASMLLALTIGFIIGNLILKNAFARIRPYELKGALVTAKELLTSVPKDYSFPSGHTLASFGAATAIYKNKKWCGVLALVLASLIGFSRLYLYVHYPSDVVVALFMGILFGNLAYYIVGKYLEYKKKDYIN